jgi:hypothetical protein
MHNKGMGDDMHKDPHYEDIVKEVLDFLLNALPPAKTPGLKMWS